MLQYCTTAHAAVGEYNSKLVDAGLHFHTTTTKYSSTISVSKARLDYLSYSIQPRVNSICVSARKRDTDTAVQQSI